MVLNSDAKPWYPNAQNPLDGEKLPLPLLRGAPMITFLDFPIQFQYVSCPVAYPLYFYHQYQPPVVAKSDLLQVENENDLVIKKKMLLSSSYSEELGGLLEINAEPLKKATRFVPPRVGKGCFQHFRGKRVWVPEISVDSDHRAKIIVRVGSHAEEDFQFRNYTTVMIKNIPINFRRNSFMELLDKCCSKHQLEYDFLYLPMDFTTGYNLGYAFVNCTSASAAMKMKEAFRGYTWGRFDTPHGTYTSKKISDATWARIQGKDALTRRFARSVFPCDTYDYLPVIISPPRDVSTIGNLQSSSKSFKK